MIGIGRNAIAALACALLCMAAIAVQAQQPIPENDKYNPARYPDWSGPMRFTTTGGNRYDQTKRPGRAQQAPLTPEYQALFEAGLKDQAEGGQGRNQTYSCLPGGLPREMAGNQGLEFVVTPKVTHVIFVQAMPRRIYTDGRNWPDDVEPTFDGYSIGKWIDEDGDGKYDVLEVETRNFKGPRTLEATGLPLHLDNQTIVKERLYLDKTNKDLLHNEITINDHAFTRPWTVTKSYRRSAEARPEWPEYLCVERSETMRIGSETYLVNKEGYLMPSKKGQKP